MSHVESVAEKVIPGKRIVWSESKHGIHARQEFIFYYGDNDVILTSREIFKIGPVRRLFIHLLKKKLHKLSVRVLDELKETSEKARE